MQIQAEYFARDPGGVLPVQLNDVVFSLHALLAASVTMAQVIVIRPSEDCSFLTQISGLSRQQSQ